MNGRRARQRRQNIRAVLRDARTRPAEYLSSIDGHDIYRRGRMMFVVPTLSEDWPLELKLAVARRREANLEGRCACGATIEYEEARAGQAVVVAMPHEADCIAHDDSIAAIVRRWREEEAAS